MIHNNIETNTEIMNSTCNARQDTRLYRFIKQQIPIQITAFQKKCGENYTINSNGVTNVNDYDTNHKLSVY